MLLKCLFRAKKAWESAAVAAGKSGGPIAAMKRAQDEVGEGSAPKRTDAGGVESCGNLTPARQK